MFLYWHITFIYNIYNDKDVWTDFHWLQVHYFPLGWLMTEWNCWPDTTQAPSNRHILRQLLEQSPTLHPWYGSSEILVQDKEIHGNISMGKQPGKMAFENKPNNVTEKSQEAEVGRGGYLKWLLTADQLLGWSLLGQLPQAAWAPLGSTYSLICAGGAGTSALCNGDSTQKSWTQCGRHKKGEHFLKHSL